MWSSVQPYLTRSLFLPVWSAVSRSRYLDYFHTFKREQRQSRNDIVSFQVQRLKRLLVGAYESTVYYRRIFDQVGFSPHSFRDLRDLHAIPVLTKAIVREHFDKLIVRGIDRRTLTENATGGSTGRPVRFFTTRDREIRQAATIALNYEWAGLPLGQRLAIIWGSPFEVSKFSGWKTKLTNVFLGRLFLPGFSLSDAIFHQYYRKLIRFRPAVLLGYTSILLAFARFLESSGLPPPKLTSVMSGAETLFPHQREYLERVFQCKVFNRYGGRDSGAVAAECPERRSMHVNWNIVHVETLPDGRILVTDLWNDAMPLIRYDTEDVGSLRSELCGCGRESPIFASLEGRVNDLLTTPDGRKVPGEFFPHLFKDVAGVKQFQVIQSTIDRLDISIVKDERTFRNDDLAYLRKQILDLFGDIMINFEFVREIPLLPSGKFRFTISKLAPSVNEPTFYG